MPSSSTNPLPQPPPHLSAKPTRNIFDAWNSSSTGHQRAENRLSGSTSWRDSRTLKLASQFSSGPGGGKRIADTVGAGSEEWGKDGRLENGGWERGASGLRGRGQMSVVEAFGVRKSGIARDEKDDGSSTHEMSIDIRENAVEPEKCATTETTDEKTGPQIFAGLCIYINGSTAPTISDHKLKTLLVAHGAHLSISLARRAVSHVILGRPNNNASSSTSSSKSDTSARTGAGGALAASKIQKEIRSKVGGGVRFVTVDWVLESIRLGRRAPEGRFEAVRLAPKGTADLAAMFARAKR